MRSTSMTAYRMSRHNVSTDRRAVLAAINKGMNDGRGGATCDEIEVLTDLLHQTCSARMNDLLNDGVIAPTGVRRLTRRRRPADVYAIVYARQAAPVAVQPALL
jgi:Fic family protein